MLVKDPSKNLDLEAVGLHPALLAQLQAATANKNLKRRASIANTNLNLDRRVSKIVIGHGIVIRDKKGKTGELVNDTKLTDKEFG